MQKSWIKNFKYKSRGRSHVTFETHERTLDRK